MHRLLGTIGLILGSVSCLYFAPINERPRPVINEPDPGPFTVNSVPSFSAAGSGDDGGADKLTAAWSAFSCDADGQNCTQIGSTEVKSSTSEMFSSSPERKGVLRIELVLTDEHGASEKAVETYSVINQAPEVELQIADSFADPGDLGGFVLGLPVHLAALPADADGDETTLTWTYEPPSGAGSVPENVTFRDVPGKTTHHELIGDVPGVWEVTVTVDDGDGGVVSATKQVVFAPDSPPCVASIAPASKPGDVVFVTGSPKRFSVLKAADALDPWPVIPDPHPQLGAATFQWSVADNPAGPFSPLVGHTSPEIIINPLEHTKGDHISLRVELADRLAQPVLCPPNEPTCSAQGNACSQRQTWEIEIR